MTTLYMKRKVVYWFFLLVALVGASALTNRVLPVTSKKEICQYVSSSRQLANFIARPAPEWMNRQIEGDFACFKPDSITAESIDELYDEIRAKLGKQILHYRIIRNKLYKYIPEGSEYSSKDTSFERAFKTLLSYAKVPDVDFLLCPMDGIPEPYVPQDFFLSRNPERQVPILGQAKRKEPFSRFIVLIPDQFSLTEVWRRDFKDTLKDLDLYPWESKKEMALWRGQLTDVGVPGDFCPNLRECPRFKICQLSVAAPHIINAGINQAESPETIAILSQEGLIRGTATKQDHLKYKYLPVLDGHMCTYPGYQWRLLSNCVAFKQESDQIQWFYCALQPYEHFIPVKNDMSDLPEQIAWAKAHDHEAKQISQTSQKFVLENLTSTHNYGYLFKVFERYARLQKIDFRSLKAQMRLNSKWECIQYRKRARFMRTLRKLMQFGKPLADAVWAPRMSDQTVECKAALQGSF